MAEWGGEADWKWYVELATLDGRGHSVQIYIRNIDNIMTLYGLRRLSGRPPYYTLYTMKTGQLDNI
jgi:hypothetical protein